MYHQFCYPRVQPIQRPPVDAIQVRPTQRDLVIASVWRCPTRDQTKK
jgi:hypothetical protein